MENTQDLPRKKMAGAESAENIRADSGRRDLSEDTERDEEGEALEAEDTERARLSGTTEKNDVIGTERSDLGYGRAGGDDRPPSHA